MLTGELCKAARALLNMKQSDLANAVGLSVVSISAFEKGGEIRRSNMSAIVQFFEKSGLVLIPENGGGVGVRFRERAGGE